MIICIVLFVGIAATLLNNVEIFNQHIDSAKKIIERLPTKLGVLDTKNFSDILSWKFTDTQLLNYNPNSPMKFEVNVSS